MTRILLKWHGIVGIVIVGIFLSLLFIRLDLFYASRSPNVTMLSDRHQVDDRETWMQIFQQGRKIGYARRILSPVAEGYKFSDDVFMRINTMGVVQGLGFSTRGTLNQDMTISTFHVGLTSNMFRFAAHGRCVGRNLTLYVGEAGEEKRYDLVMKDIPYASGNIADAAIRSGLKVGEARTLSIFDAASMGVRPVHVSLLGDEIRSFEGKPQKLTKLSVDFMGARQYVWLDEKGRVMREEGMMGLALERTTKEAALQGLNLTDTAGADMAAWASVASNMPIPKPEDLDVLKLKIKHIDSRRFFLDGGRQSYRNDIMTIQKELLAKMDGEPHVLDAKSRQILLRSTPFVQAEHSHIRDALKDIVADRDAPKIKMQKIVHWVYHYLEKQPVLSISNAVETLALRKGDCTEHAVLVAALGRAAGIPVTIETGLMYQKGRFYYHAWNVFYIDEWSRWITADAVFDQIPADVTHLRFVRGEFEEQLDLIGLLGQLQLEIIR